MKIEQVVQTVNNLTDSKSWKKSTTIGRWLGRFFWCLWGTVTSHNQPRGSSRSARIITNVTAKLLSNVISPRILQHQIYISKLTSSPYSSPSTPSKVQKTGSARSSNPLMRRDENPGAWRVMAPSGTKILGQGSGCARYYFRTKDIKQKKERHVLATWRWE